MKKIFTNDKIRKADSFTIENEPISSWHLMERASRQIASWILNHYSKQYNFIFILGKGNNAGDGLAVARMISAYGYKGYYYLALGPSGSEDFNENLSRLKTESPSVTALTDVDAIKEIRLNEGNVVWVDCLFGSGLSRSIEGSLAQLIRFLNAQKGAKLAIDIPSGLFADQPTAGIAFEADITLSLQFPKLAFMMPENNKSVGEWYVLPIGLSDRYIDTTETSFYLTEQQDVVLPQISPFAHKGVRGRCTIIAGGHGRMGAALLATKAALRSGAGLVSVQACQHCIAIVQNSIPEALILIDEHENALGQYLDYNNQDVIVFGPAVGFANKTLQLFKELLQKYTGQLILDADAITLLANNKSLLKLLPPGTILTPHIGEFDRLVGEQANHFDRLQKLIDFAKSYRCNVLLKGKYSVIANAEGNLYFNTTGNHGMAKGGSGDVLSGMIAGLFPMYNNAFLALRAAVCLHGLSGDILAKRVPTNQMIPSDLIENLHTAQKKLHETQ